jgi:hypothetical protein
MSIGIWHISDDGPSKLKGCSIDIERSLEDWIENDPSLLQSGLTIVGRQFPVDAGRVDLLALDPQGRWVVIEIKRGQLRRETVAQVIDYASCISTVTPDELSSKTNDYLRERGITINSLLQERSALDAIELDNRELVLIIEGVGKQPGMERIINFLANQYQLPISVISFELFEGHDGSRLLVRVLSEPDYAVPEKKSGVHNVEKVCELSDSVGIGKSFRMILSIAQELGLYPRPYKKSIMYTPPFQRNRMLFTVWAEKRNNGLRLYITPKEFAEFYSVSEDEAAAALQLANSGWQELNENDVVRFIENLRNLFTIIDKRSNSD